VDLGRKGKIMKVKDLLKSMNELDPEDDVCALFWIKPHYEFLGEDELKLTDEGWAEVCKEFDEWDNAGQDVTEWIADAVIEKAEINS
jgi:hypothetical protein